MKLIEETIQLYFINGARSSKKVDYLHKGIIELIEKKIPPYYKLLLEENVKSYNTTECKKCDIVIQDTRTNTIKYVFPVKFMMTNYKQNKNNYWESLTGECCHLKWKNPDINIIPINIIFNRVPYLDSDKKIKKFEDIDYTSSLEVYQILKENCVCKDIVSYIFNIEHMNKVGELYNNVKIVEYNEKTPYREWSDILCLNDTLEENP
jgi:hypothetical protein